MLMSLLATLAKLVTWLFDSGIEFPLSSISNIDLKNCVVSLLVRVGLCLLMKIKCSVAVHFLLVVACQKVSRKSQGCVCVNFVLSLTSVCVVVILLRLLFVLEGGDRVQDLLGRLLQGHGSHLPGRRGGVDGGGEGVDLGHGEPGQGGEHEVEQVLAHVDHDVVVLEDALLDGLTEKKMLINITVKNSRELVDLPIPSPPVSESSKERCGGGEGLGDALGVPVVSVGLDDESLVSDPGSLGDDGGLVIGLVLGLGGGDGDQEEGEQRLEHDDLCEEDVEV